MILEREFLTELKDAIRDMDDACLLKAGKTKEEILKNEDTMYCLWRDYQKAILEYGVHPDIAFQDTMKEILGIEIKEENDEDDKNTLDLTGAMRLYDIFHIHMRDAQCFSGDCDDMKEDIATRDCEWRDFYDEPHLDTIYAKDQDDALKKAAESTGYHESNLYALEHTASSHSKDKSNRCTASAYMTETHYGIEVTLLDGRKVIISVSNENGELAVRQE